MDQLRSNWKQALAIVARRVCRLGEHLVGLGWLTEQDLYTAFSLQNNLPLGKPEANDRIVPQ